MNTYRVIIKNSANCEVYNALINAETENEALMELIKEEIITVYSGDSLTIEEE